MNTVYSHMRRTAFEPNVPNAFRDFATLQDPSWIGLPATGRDALGKFAEGHFSISVP
jgi:hypothetical protein